MPAMTATGWDAAGAITILKTYRPYGPQQQRQALVQLVLTATNFGNGAHFYPSSPGIPLPSPTRVGFRESIDYVIPLGALVGATGISRYVMWGCQPPTGGVSGTTPGLTPGMRVAGLVGATPSGGPTYILEAVTTLAASTLFTTNALQTFALFVGR